MPDAFETIDSFMRSMEDFNLSYLRTTQMSAAERAVQQLRSLADDLAGSADNTDSVKSNGQGDFTDENGMYLRLKDGRLAFYPKGPDGRVTSDEHILPDGVAATLRHALSLDDGTRLTADDLTILASAEHRTAYFDRLPDDEDMRRYGSQPVRTPAQQELAEDFYATCVKAGFESPEVEEIDAFLAADNASVKSTSDELSLLREMLGWPLEDRRDMTIDEIEQRIAELTGGEDDRAWDTPARREAQALYDAAVEAGVEPRTIWGGEGPDELRDQFTYLSSEAALEFARLIR